MFRSAFPRVVVSINSNKLCLVENFAQMFLQPRGELLKQVYLRIPGNPCGNDDSLYI